MNILIAGGTGFLGSALAASLQADGHQVTILTRRKPRAANHVHWDGQTAGRWGQIINEMDALINVSGYSLDHAPWTQQRKRRFEDSRVLPARALVSAIAGADRRLSVYLQTSGINYYGLRGSTVADESTPPGDDFLAQLSVKWEDASQPLEQLGVRRIICRSAVVLHKSKGLFPLMKLPVNLFFGGKFGDGRQAMPWIHIVDEIDAMKFLLTHKSASGAFNLISPAQTSNAEFMRGVAWILHRPYWFHLPSFLLRVMLGEMSVLLTEGRYSQPKRLLDFGFTFEYDTLKKALANLSA